MPRFSISRSIRIKAPVDRVHATVRNFREWPEWSPWLIAEPDCPLDFSDDGKSYAWDGRITGSGRIEIVSEDAPRLIRYRLTFLKPWKSVSDVSFAFRDAGGETEVTWTMDGSLPWFMFWMKGMMSALIGADYERGLTMLAQLVEGGKVRSKLEFPGVRDFPGCRYIGIRTTCPIPEIGNHMRRNMEKLVRWAEANGATPSAPPVSICHTWKPVAGTTEMTLAFPLDPPPETAPDGMVVGEIPACSCYVVQHTGPYPQLGNAWSSGMMRARSGVFAQNKSIAPFETYANDPAEVAEDELVTLVHLPAKA